MKYNSSCSRWDVLGSPELKNVAVVIAKVDEEQAAVVANAMRPARQAYRVPDMLGAKLSAGMGTVAMHGGLLSADPAGQG